MSKNGDLHINGNLPIIGEQKPRAGINTIGVLIRDLDENGTYEPDKVVMAPNGQLVVTQVGRHNFVTASELCEMIREVVHEEIAAAKGSA